MVEGERASRSLALTMPPKMSVAGADRAEPLLAPAAVAARSAPAPHSPSWEEMMLELESLDYDAVLNAASIQRMLDADSGHERRQRSTVCVCIRPSKLRGLIKWLVTLAVGVTTGLTAFFVEAAIDQLTMYRLQFMQRFPIQPGSPPANVFFAFGLYAGIALVLVSAATIAVIFFAPAAAGSGFTLVMAYLNGIHVPELLSLRTTVVKIVGTVFSVSSGLPVGPEAPLVHIGTGIASFFSRQHSLRLCGRNFQTHSRWLDDFHNDRDRRDFISSGAAAGLAAAFGAPIGGVLFSLEEASSFWSQRVTWRSFFCAAIATFSLALCHRNNGKLSSAGLLSLKGLSAEYYVWELIPFALTGVAGGLLGVIFIASYRKLLAYRPKGRLGRVAESCSVMLFVVSLQFWLPFYVGNCKDKDSVMDDPDFGVGFNCAEGEYNDLATLFMFGRDETITAMLQMRNGSGAVRWHSRSSGAWFCLAPALVLTASCFAQPATSSSFSVNTLVVFCVVNLVTMILSFGICVPSGLFMPTIMTGAALGGLIGKLVEAFATKLQLASSEDAMMIQVR